MIAALGAWLVAYDNLSHLPQWLSDCLCRLATGGGFSTRMLYTDDEEMIFSAKRPVLLTSIEDVVVAGDLLDRSVRITLDQIEPAKRRTETEVWAAFNQGLPQVLGALLDAVCGGLRLLPGIKLASLPRMADFALWAEACCQAAGLKPLTFLSAYNRCRQDSVCHALEASTIAAVLLGWVEAILDVEETPVGGSIERVTTASELLRELNARAGDRAKQKGWPTRPNHLTGQLRRIAPALRQVGVEVIYDRTGKNRNRNITIRATALDNGGNSSSAPSASSANEEEGNANDCQERCCGEGNPPEAESDSSSTHRPPIVRPSSAEPAPGSPRGEADDQHPPGGRSADDDGAEGSSAIFINPDNDLRQGGRSADDADDEFSSLSRERYHLVRDPVELPMVIGAIDTTTRIGIDTETTGLSWCRDKARLLSLGCARADGVTSVFLLDLFALPADSLSDLWDTLRDKEIIGHNLAFDLAFLSRLGFTPGERPLQDVMILSRLLTSGGRDGNTLADLTQRYLGITLDKEEQRSDWARPELTDKQLAYAAADVLHLDALLDRLTGEIDKSRLTKTAEIERRCLPAWLWMATAGLPVDHGAWKVLAGKSRAERDRLLDELHRQAPQKPGELPGVGAGWNFDSQPQVKEMLHLLGFQVEDTKDETLAGIDHPVVALLRQYRFAKWLDGTYGATFLRFIDANGRVYANWVQTGNEAGRSSCKEPNLQQVPRQDDYRRAFVAPPGKVLIKADFAAAHLRIACCIAGEEKMLAAFREGKDLHRLTAASLLGKPEAEVTKQDRQLAKAVAFGLLYGMGAKTLRIYALQNYGVAMTLEEAKRHRSKFFETYPCLAAWHRRTAAECGKPGEARSLANRRRLLDPKTPIMHRLNSPVLGTEADAAKTALGLLWERKHECPGARPVAFIHDEILVEADADKANAAAAWLKAAMIEGMAPLIDPVPVEVEVRIGRTWGGD
jgi:DNA polymerase-1